MLNSSIFSSSRDLAGVEAGARRIMAPEVSDSVALIQQGLLATGFDLPDVGVDGGFGTETGAAVSAFKTDRLLVPADPVVGTGTIRRLDSELFYLDGNAPNPQSIDAKTLLLDPFFAGVLEHQLADPGIGRKVLDALEFNDTFCFRASFLFGGFLTISLGRMVEPFVFDDYCRNTGPCHTRTDFVDLDPGSSAYVDWLLLRNPHIDPFIIGQLAGRRRPDILRHRQLFEWYEIKPASIHGAVQAWIKLNSIVPDYAAAGLPYVPGKSYTPSREILLGRFVTPQGEPLDVLLVARRKTPGLIFWTLCVKGEWVQYFNRTRLAAGILALLVAVGNSLAEAGAGAIAAKKALQLAFELGLPELPTLVPAM